MKSHHIIIGIALATLALFSAAVFLFVSGYRIPDSPHFSVTSVSTTFRNVVDDNRIIADLDVSFLVQNKAEKGMVFDHLSASATQRYKLDYYRAKAGTPLDPFELGGYHESFKETVSFSLKNVMLGFHAWERNSSAFSYIHFALTSNVTYRGKVWPKQRIPMHVLCEPLRIPFSSNATETKTVHFTVNCEADGLWNHLHATFLLSGMILFSIPLPISIVYNCLHS